MKRPPLHTCSICPVMKEASFRGEERDGVGEVVGCRGASAIAADHEAE